MSKSSSYGSYLQVDLKKDYTLRYVDVVWYNGQTDAYNFKIDVLDPKANSWQTVYQGRSKKSALPERYDFVDREARGIKVTLIARTLHGGALDQNGGIAELRAWGDTKGETPTQPELICPDGFVRDPVTKECVRLPDEFEIKSVSGTGKPEAVIDGKKSTAWTAKDKTDMITADLGGVKPVKSVGIKWKGGSYEFNIQASQDGNSFSQILGGQKSEKQENKIQQYGFPGPVDARFIRIVTNSKKASIITLKVFPRVGEIEEGEEPVVDENPDIPAPVPPVGGVIDENDMLLIYPTAGSGTRTSKKFSHEEKTRNYASGAASEPTTECTATVSPPIVNECFSGYVRVPKYGKNDKISLKMRGGAHSKNDKGKAGSVYAFEIPTDGKPKGNWCKEGPHPKYDFFDIPWNSGVLGKSVLDRWIGFQAYLWNVDDDTKVYGEFYVNETPFVDEKDFKPDNRGWKLAYSVFDDKDGRYGKDSGGHTTAKPYVKPFGDRTTLRVDGPKHIEVKYLKVREFAPPFTKSEQIAGHVSKAKISAVERPENEAIPVSISLN